MLQIPVPEISFSSTNLLLGGFEYTFIYSFNERDSRWRIDIFLQDEPVITGVKVVESQDLLSNYELEEFDHGSLFCLRVGASFDEVGRDNFGIDKNYQLIYFTNEEIAAL